MTRAHVGKRSSRNATSGCVIIIGGARRRGVRGGATSVSRDSTDGTIDVISFSIRDIISKIDNTSSSAVHHQFSAPHHHHTSDIHRVNIHRVNIHRVRQTQTMTAYIPYIPYTTSTPYVDDNEWWDDDDETLSTISSSSWTSSSLSRTIAPPLPYVGEKTRDTTSSSVTYATFETDLRAIHTFLLTYTPPPAISSPSSSPSSPQSSRRRPALPVVKTKERGSEGESSRGVTPPRAPWADIRHVPVPMPTPSSFTEVTISLAPHPPKTRSRRHRHDEKNHRPPHGENTRHQTLLLHRRNDNDDEEEYDLRRLLPRTSSSSSTSATQDVPKHARRSPPPSTPPSHEPVGALSHMLCRFGPRCRLRSSECTRAHTLDEWSPKQCRRHRCAATTCSFFHMHQESKKECLQRFVQHQTYFTTHQAVYAKNYNLRAPRA